MKTGGIIALVIGCIGFLICIVAALDGAGNSVARQLSTSIGLIVLGIFLVNKGNKKKKEQERKKKWEEKK